MLRRVQGSGNYVHASGRRSGVYAFLGLEKPGGGGLPTARVLSVALLPKPAGVPFFGPSSQAHRIRRLRSLDAVVVALEEIWLDASYAKRLPADDLGQALYLHYRQALGLVIARIEDRVGLGVVPDWADATFPLAPGAVAGHVARTAWARGGAAAEISQTWFDTKVARYIAREGQE